MATKVLFLAAEVNPLAKVGGLADVAGALPVALADLGVDVRLATPLYHIIDRERYGVRPTGLRYSVTLGGVAESFEVYETAIPGSTVPLYLLENATYLSGGSGGVYHDPTAFVGDDDNLEVKRFLAYSRAAAELPRYLGWHPEIFHCHDWHTATVPSLLHLAGQATPTLFTIHNLANQGGWGVADVARFLNLGPADLAAAGWANRRRLNLMQEGIGAATQVSTVSPTYAAEVLTPEFGVSLEGDLRRLARGVVGILNGLDTVTFNPATDPNLPARYSAADLSGKAACKLTLQSELGLRRGSSGPVLAVISRLTDQKGLDLLVTLVPELVQRGSQVVVLGTGKPELEEAFRRAARRWPESVAAHLGFEASLAQRIYAGADIFLMPSRFEPCGLGQLIAMRYGTVPVVRRVGGLADTVHDFEAGPGTGNGFTFTELTAEGLRGAVGRALELYRQPSLWRRCILNGMEADYSWARSARAYLELYASLQQT